ncbi:DUF134 domain-containing protein [Francisella sciaenopsi]|uniref:UPF0251 protein fsci_11130 n=1 Tax=Francisella sciaenopsi TaxID=3055034 RepID=A0ABQ6PFX5_9GAMM
MPRPRIKRCIANEPSSLFYKPQAIRMKDLQQITLSYDQLEALRLADVENMKQANAAERMNISSSTFSRLIAEARYIVASALTKGWALKIEGGNFEISTNIKTHKEKQNEQT